jgi:hypothetical protein
MKTFITSALLLLTANSSALPQEKKAMAKEKPISKMTKAERK